MPESKLVSEEQQERIAEIKALQKKMTGLVNSLDSRAEKVNTLHHLVDELVAGVDVSKIEKAGILAFVASKRSA